MRAAQRCTIVYPLSIRWSFISMEYNIMATKNSTKKTSARRTAKKATRMSFADNARIRVLVEENPAREGTGRFDRVKRIMRHNGKTVAEFVKHGGKLASLSFSVKKNWIKVAAK